MRGCPVQLPHMTTSDQAMPLRKVSSWSSMRGSGDLPLRQLIKALVAVNLGTMMMWYNVTIYAQLSKTLGKLFFPAVDPSMQAISFWGVFFAGFISRPVGAIVFGHLGDTRGRSKCLLHTVLVNGIPTVLIGCLPVYDHIGAAAPILLASLSLIQGLGMGGETGAAKVYLLEIADPRFKAFTGSLNFISLGVGVVLGILVDVVIISLVPADGLAVWGWRLPFLFALATLLAATLLRSGLPESAEFTTSQDVLDESHHRCHKRSVLQKTEDFLPTVTPHVDVSSDGGSDAASVGLSLRASSSKDHLAASSSDADLACVVADNLVVKDVDAESQLIRKKRHGVPVIELFRCYWTGLALQVGYEAWIAASFYLAYTWLPSFYATYVGLTPTLTLWMVLTSMVVFTFVVPIAGILSDRGSLPPVTATIMICVVAAGMSVPMFLAFQTKHLAACWLLQTVSLCMTAYTMGVLPVICSNIYPASVRISGVNLGHNIGMAVFGGLTPLIITAIQSSTGSIFIGPGLWMTVTAVISVTCSLLLRKLYPLTNKVA